MSYLHVPTALLEAGPLLLRRSTDTDFTVEIAAGGFGRLPAGRIMRVQLSAPLGVTAGTSILGS